MFKVEAKSRKQFRKLAKLIRNKLGVSEDEPFDSPKILESIHLWDKNAHYEIVEPWELKEGQHAVTDIVSKTIKVREDVYEGAVMENLEI